jgi:hypothetical protein
VGKRRKKWRKKEGKNGREKCTGKRRKFKKTLFDFKKKYPELIYQNKIII